MMGMLASLGVGIHPMMRGGGSFRGKYGKCEVCGNPTKERGRCKKCKDKLITMVDLESQPDILILHADGRKEAIHISSPFVMPKLDGTRGIYENNHDRG